MAPTRFQIYVDQSIRQTNLAASVGVGVGQQPVPQSIDEALSTNNNPTNAPDQPSRYKPEVLPPNLRFYFDERKLYPVNGGEFSFEEINYFCWMKRQQQMAEKMRVDDIQRENEELKQKIELLINQVTLLVNAQKQMQNQPPLQSQHQFGQHQKPQQAPPSPPIMTNNRLSIVPQSLQPTQGLEYTDMPLYGAINDAPSVVQDYWSNTLAHDKFTLPIDQSQYIKENVPTSTPTSKRSGGSGDNENKRSTLNNRRLSRPSMGGSPTLKLSPITETSRDCNSKSSSSSSAMSGTPSTTKKGQPHAIEPVVIDEPDRPLNPNDPTTYRRLLVGLAEPLDRRSGYFRLNRSFPKIRQGVCFQAGTDSYLVDKELSQEAKMFTAQLLTDDSNDSSTDIPIKTICFRVDQPANEWLYYICNELHRRLVKQKTKPDIELSVMIANPAIMYNDGSLLVDEYFRFVSLQHFFDACSEMNKPFPKSVAAYITLELIQLVRQMHTCDIVHMNINPKNVLITCCPTREDIANVDERTSIVKLIGFDRAMDIRLLPPGFKFDVKLDNLVTCQMMDSQPWSHEVDWFGTLNCIYKMFFLENMSVCKNEGRWAVDKQFKGFPTNVWNSMFDKLLNIEDMKSATSVIDQAIDELNTWIKANISFVLKEADSLDRVLEEYLKETNKSIRT